MRKYECLYIIDAELEDEAIQAEVDKYAQLLEKHECEEISIDAWGKRRLAYEIRKKREGYYVLMEYNGPADFVSELERLMGIDEKVMKYLVTKKEK